MNGSFTAYLEFSLFLGAGIAQSRKGRVELYPNYGIFLNSICFSSEKRIVFRSKNLLSISISVKIFLKRSEVGHLIMTLDYYNFYTDCNMEVLLNLGSVDSNNMESCIIENYFA